MNLSSSLAGCHSPFCRDSFPSTSSIPTLHQRGRLQHSQGHKHEAGHCVQASIREHWSQLGANRCVKNNIKTRFKHVSRVGSFLRNLEQEDDTERKGNGDDDTASNPLSGVDFEEDDSEAHQGVKKVAEEKNGGLASQGAVIAGRGDGKRSLGSLLDAGDSGWRDAVVQGVGYSNGTLQLRPGVGKDDEDSTEVSL